MRLAVNISVKDEAELIESVIYHTWSIGADVIVACDIGSTDGTLEILRRHCRAEKFYLVELNEQTTTAEWSRATLEVVKSTDVDWVAFIDADEFLLPATDQLRDSALVDVDILYIDRFNIPVGPEGPLKPAKLGSVNAAETLLIVKPIPDFRSFLANSPETPWIRGVPGRKLMARPRLIQSIADGAHDIDPITGCTLRQATSQNLIIAHLPFTTRTRFRKKLNNIRKVFLIHDKYMETTSAGIGAAGS